MAEQRPNRQLAHVARPLSSADLANNSCGNVGMVVDLQGGPRRMAWSAGRWSHMD